MYTISKRAMKIEDLYASLSTKIDSLVCVCYLCFTQITKQSKNKLVMFQYSFDAMILIPSATYIKQLF